MVDATETGPFVVTSLIYENQFSTWALSMESISVPWILESNVQLNMLPDVDGNQWLTPLDVLVVINWINRTGDTGLFIEAESTAIAPSLPSFASLTESTKRTSEQTSLLDDSFASLSLDWNLHDEELGSAEHMFSKPLKRFATGRHLLAKH